MRTSLYIFITVLSLSLAAPTRATAQATATARQEILANPNLSGGNPAVYPEPTGVTYTRPPRGYKPCYLSAYIRHGSRFHWDTHGYSRPHQTLQKAHDADKLTPLGQHVYGIVDSLTRAADRRIGELTQIGARQHRGIAQRMVRNFPEIFRADVRVSARSSTAVRCALSMLNECWTIEGLCPKAVIRCNASEHDMSYINYEEPRMKAYRKRPESRQAFDDAYHRLLQADRLMGALFNDTAYVAHHVKKDQLFMELYSLANHVQNHDVYHDARGRNPQLDLFPIFTDDELYDWAKFINYYNYLTHGYNTQTLDKAPLTRASLLRNIILTADTCLASGRRNVTLRFGHDMVLMPLACLMHLGNCAAHADSPEELITEWRNYNIFPMAGNIQLVFYRKKNAPTLVKVMLNEREQTLPLHSDTAPYYPWHEVRAYYMGLLEQADTE